MFIGCEISAKLSLPCDDAVIACVSGLFGFCAGVMLWDTGLVAIAADSWSWDAGLFRVWLRALSLEAGLMGLRAGVVFEGFLAHGM